MQITNNFNKSIILIMYFYRVAIENNRIWFNIKKQEHKIYHTFFKIKSKFKNDGGVYWNSKPKKGFDFGMYYLS